MFLEFCTAQYRRHKSSSARIQLLQSHDRKTCLKLKICNTTFISEDFLLKLAFQNSHLLALRALVSDYQLILLSRRIKIISYFRTRFKPRNNRNDALSLANERTC